MKRTAVAAMLALTVFILACHEPAAAEDTTVRWLSFDPEDASLPDTEHCTATRSTDARAGAGCLVITTPKPMKEVASVVFSTPGGLNLSRMRALAAHIRTAPVPGPVVMRWHACDADGNTLRQRAFEFDQGPVWTRVEFPLSLWRWDTARAGRWDEIRRIGLTIESRVAEVRLDELTWLKGDHDDSAYPTHELYHELAFEGRETRTLARNDYRLVTDAVEEVSERDLDALHGRFAPIPQWVRRVFGPAVRPLRDDHAMPVLIFADKDGYDAFFSRLATIWRVAGTRRASSSYAVQDVVASRIDAEKGLDRGVFFHEVVRATAGRLLRVLPGAPKHLWLQEAMANYLQLCLYPDALRLGVFASMFEHEPGDVAYFRPLKQLLTGDIAAQHYAQLASLMAYLVEKRPEWLPDIARGVADGRRLTAILKDLETSIEATQSEWLKWGRARFKPDDERHFEVPAEWDEGE